MTPRNSYVTLTDFKNFIRSRGGSVKDDMTDDATIEDLLEAGSRYIDSKTVRMFYPYIKTAYYDVPEDEELFFDDSVQEVITLTNGDNTSIAAASYNLIPLNMTPKYSLKIKGSVSVSWQADSAGETIGVITLVSLNGYHSRYSDAWEAVTTLAEDLDASETGIDVTSGTNFVSGHIIRIGNEINIVDSKATNTLTVLKRGDNGSTAATHLTGDTVYIWRPMKDCEEALLEWTNSAYMRRYGQGESNNATTATEAVYAPPQIPVMMREFIGKYTVIV